MHTLQVKLSNECGINYAQALLRNRIDICSSASRQAVELCTCAHGKELEELVIAFCNGLQNIRMI